MFCKTFFSPLSPTILRFVLWAALCTLTSNIWSQQQNADEVPGVGVDQGEYFGSDTNYGLTPNVPNDSFDRRTNPVDYPHPEEVNRNTVSTSLVGLAQGYLYVEWEHLTGRMFGLVLGATFYASEISQTRRLFSPAEIDSNSFMNLGGIFGFTFYVNQSYVQGVAVQIKFGGGVLTGNYTESGQNISIDMLDFYGSAMFIFAWRINLTPKIALSPILMINANVIIVNGDYNNSSTVPSYYRINGHSSIFSLSTPADLTGAGNLLLFMHVGIGFDLTFTF